MFKDRKEAGQQLAVTINKQQLRVNRKNSIILALPRGGVIVGAEIAKILKISLDIIVVRKIGYPGNPEYAIGAVGESGELVLSEEGQRVAQEYLKEQVEKEKAEIKRRLKEYRGKRLVPELKNKRVILVDDGLATGMTIKVAIKEVKKKQPKKIILALPVAPPEAIEALKKEVSSVICLEKPSPFFAISNFYQEFPQVQDQEVKQALVLGQLD